ncbi:MAG TPA: diguanylate cyclase [Ideonella sp.]|uniref:diguanylate cyclase domain-containing protein n=1 Tax=Ideonella sp. TaxID=1929293 RepID=UPI002CE85010|nr:diguanylate cyclase [Ideonella sp.]HSI46951.1 diguanylate cyclase [Ideonella sp.]
MHLPSFVSRCCASLWLGLILGFTWPLAQAAEAVAPADAGRWQQLADPVFRHFPIPTALQATAMVQDDQGFLWLGTQNGLARWDGYRFRHHEADANRPGALPDSYITTLHRDALGQVWIGSSAGGLSRLALDHASFIRVPGGPNGLSHRSVFALADDGQGGLWVGGGAGLDQLAADGRQVRRHAQNAHAQGLPDGAVQSLLRDRSGGLWVGTRMGLFRRAAGASRFEPLLLPCADGSPSTVSQLIEDHEGRVWIGTRPHGAYVVAPGDTRAVTVQDSERSGAAGLASDSVLALVEAADGDVWIGTDGGGIVRVDSRSGRTRRLRHLEGAPASLQDNEIGMLYRDRSGTLWVGTTNGLSAYRPDQRAVLTWMGLPGRATGISHGTVSHLLAQPDDRAWLALGNGGVDIVDPVLGRIAQLQPDATRPREALPKGRVLTMAGGADGAVYLGTQQGLYRADANAQAVHRVVVPGRAENAATWALCLQGDQLWLGGLDGLWGFRVLPGGSLQPLPGARADAAQLGDGRVTRLALAEGDGLWVGTRAGLLRYDRGLHEVTRLPEDTPARLGVPAAYISAIQRDARGRLWIGLFGAGIRVVEPAPADGSAPKVHRIGLAEGLPNNGVDAMLIDPRGDVWASTDDGLARIDGSDLSVTPLHAADGVGIPSYWVGAGGITPQGELLFGGSGGLTIVRPEQLRPWNFEAPVVVTEALAGGSVASGPATAGEVLTLPVGKRELSVEFAALDYSAPEANRYAYRLKGFDAEWLPTDPSRRLARYTNLPAGDYVLELRGSNRQGHWSEPLRWPVRVLPAWYETTWFRIALGLAALLLVAGLVQGRTLMLRRRQQVLETLVASRTAELEQRSAELHESERQLQQMAYYDGLTGLANRRLFNEDLKRLLAEAQRGQPFTLLLLDLDHFKQINDTLGHDAGDALLVAVAQRLREAVREVDRVARLGGDEFALLLTRTSATEDVEHVCRRIIDSLDLAVEHQAQHLQASASIGLARCPNEAGSAVELYKRADLALYAAKRAGRRGWRWYTPAAN